MAINVLTKTPGDARRFKFDCKKALEPDERIEGGIDVIISALGRIKNAAPLVKGTGNDVPRYTEDAVYVHLSGGSDEEDYRVVVRFRTNRSSAVEVFGDLRVRSIRDAGEAGTD